MASTKSNSKGSAHKAQPHAKESKSKNASAAKGRDKAHAGKAAASQARSRSQPGHKPAQKSKADAKSHTGNKPAASRARGSQEKKPSQSNAKGRGREGGQARNGADAGNESKVSKALQSAKDHPLATAAMGAGVGLMLIQGVRKAISAVSNGASADDGDSGDQSGAQSSADVAEQDRTDEEEDDGSGAQASADDDDEQEQSDDDGEDDHRARGDASDESDPSEENADEDENDSDSGGIVRHSVAAVGRFGRQGVSRVASGLSTGATAVGGLARKGYQRGKDTSAQAWQSYPLVICALAIALGAAAGALLPASDMEDKLMGKTANRIGGRLKKAGKKLLKQGKQLAGKTLSEVVDVTSREIEREGLSPQRIGRKIKRVASEVRSAVTDTLEG